MSFASHALARPDSLAKSSITLARTFCHLFRAPGRAERQGILYLGATFTAQHSPNKAFDNQEQGGKKHPSGFCCVELARNRSGRRVAAFNDRARRRGSIAKHPTPGTFVTCQSALLCTSSILVLTLAHSHGIKLLVPELNSRMTSLLGFFIGQQFSY